MFVLAEPVDEGIEGLLAPQRFGKRFHRFFHAEIGEFKAHRPVGVGIARPDAELGDPVRHDLVIALDETVRQTLHPLGRPCRTLFDGAAVADAQRRFFTGKQRDRGISDMGEGVRVLPLLQVDDLHPELHRIFVVIPDIHSQNRTFGKVEILFAFLRSDDRPLPAAAFRRQFEREPVAGHFHLVGLVERGENGAAPGDAEKLPVSRGQTRRQQQSGGT